MKKLRLLFTKDCNRNCEGCCNKEWNLESLPICTDFTGYNEILITGGEPLLYSDKLEDLCREIRKANKFVKIYLYTAKSSVDLIYLLSVNLIDGVTLTLHEQKDEHMFHWVDLYLLEKAILNKSLKLNVFAGINCTPSFLWEVKSGMKWIKNCPLPKDEVFMKI